jgi:hypothetical protein
MTLAVVTPRRSARVRTIGIALLLAAVAFACQAPAASDQTTAAAKTRIAPRTLWGNPDLQGIWTGSSLTPLERPKEFAGREFLTEEEAAALEERAVRSRVDRPPEPGDPGTYNQVWYDPASKVVSTRRTSLIVDPPDGRIPFTPEGQKHNARSTARYGVGPRDSWVDLDTGERCLTDGLPLPYWTGYNNNYQILQTREYVVILAEMFRDRRIIPLDGLDGRRPHGNVPQWLGNSRGHWEGGTLVVETTNFADKAHYWWVAAWRASRPTLRLIERFTRVDAETMDYQFTMEDPVMFTRPWTAAFPLTTNQASRGVTVGRLYEYACHEGNYSLANVLAGARARDKAAQEAAKKTGGSSR